MALPSEIASRWRGDVVLKRDLFSTVERGFYRGADGEYPAVLRRIDQVPWWTWGIARVLFAREHRALAIAGTLGIAPPLLAVGRNALVRGWIDGVALHISRPLGDAGYFRSAKAVLRRLHRVGICHNDLAKEQNWLRGADGHAYLTDFQLASRFRRKNWLYRVAAYEDLRHLLKHKQRYAPAAVTAAERRVLARKSIFTRVWMVTGKKVYMWITRGMFGFSDREGGGPRLVDDAPRLTTRLKAHPQVRDAVIVAYPDRRAGTGLYAFIESDAPVSEDALRDFIVASGERAAPPEYLQIAAALPRRESGEVRSEILQLVAMNQVDQISPLIANETERAVVASIVADRLNLRDRFSF